MYFRWLVLEVSELLGDKNLGISVAFGSGDYFKVNVGGGFGRFRG